jgi:hypothetical protein
LSCGLSLNYVEAYLRIVSLLASQGQLPLAMNWLKEGLKECPHDPKLNDLSTVLSTFMGGYKPALERDPEPVTKPVGPETLPSEVSPESSPATQGLKLPLEAVRTNQLCHRASASSKNLKENDQRKREV